MDGTQVFGSQTIPITLPTLAWRLTSEGEKRYATKIYSGFGLYRGPSLEDPATQLYFDSIRSGNSYSQVAPESRFLTPHIEAETFGVNFKGAGLPELTTNLGTFKCTGTALEGTAANPTSQLSLTPKYGECEITSGGTKYVASVKTNGCHYNLGVKNAGPPYTGTWGVTCEKEGEALEYRLTPSALNCLKLYPQSGLEGINLSTSGEGSKRAIGLEAEIKGLKYEWTGACGKGEVRTDGVFKGTAVLNGSNENGGQAGVYLTGKP